MQRLVPRQRTADAGEQAKAIVQAPGIEARSSDAGFDSERTGQIGSATALDAYRWRNIVGALH